jgi:hypothetical protein
MDGLIVFIDSCAASDIQCDWKQNYKPALTSALVSDILHTTNQLNPLARTHAQQLVEELQYNPALIRSACMLMLRLNMCVACRFILLHVRMTRFPNMSVRDVLQEWRSHPNRQSDPHGAPLANNRYSALFHPRLAGTMAALVDAPKHAASIAPAHPLLPPAKYAEVSSSDPSASAAASATASATASAAHALTAAAGCGVCALHVHDGAAEGPVHLSG